MSSLTFQTRSAIRAHVIEINSGKLVALPLLPKGIDGCRSKAARSRKNENRIDSEKSSCRPRVGGARDRDERMCTPRCSRGSGLRADPHRGAGNGGSAATTVATVPAPVNTEGVGTSPTPAVISGPAAVDNSGRAYTSSSAGWTGNGSAIGTNTNVNLIPKNSSSSTVTVTQSPATVETTETTRDHAGAGDRRDARTGPGDRRDAGTGFRRR